MDAYKIFWGDTHHNTYMDAPQNPSVSDVLAFAKTYLDFYTGAYYTPVAHTAALKKDQAAAALPEAQGHPAQKAQAEGCNWKGIRVEQLKDVETMTREWHEFEQAIQAHHMPGKFVPFAGYEWQGDGAWGDHNVFFKEDGNQVSTAMTLPDLYNEIRNKNAMAIPHHIAYHPGIRAPLWEYCDEKISPFAEIYSIHGCSETDEEWIGLRKNTHMGPGAAKSTYQAALDQGLHLGAICSTDNWTNVPGCWNQGLMACLATELTRDSLWEAFQNRRVYGVTGDRIELGFTCNEQPMGSILKHTATRKLKITVKGQDAIDRIEVLRNDRVIETYCHQGTWSRSLGNETTRFKIRIEAGWGPRLGEMPALVRHWLGEMTLSEGRFVGWSPCWIARGQKPPILNGHTARFEMVSCQAHVGEDAQGAIVLEFESRPSAQITLQLNGKTLKSSVQAFAQNSQLLWYREECIDMIQQTTGIAPEEFERQDPLFYHYAFKAKIHRVIPEDGYAASFSLTDTDPLSGETNYRVRIEQRNGQRAWSSPIWIQSQV